MFLRFQAELNFESPKTVDPLLTETSSLDLYQYFSHTLRRGEMTAGGPFQMLNLIPTRERRQMSFTFLFMLCLAFTISNCLLHYNVLCPSVWRSFYHAFFGLSEDISRRLGWNWGVCGWSFWKRRGMLSGLGWAQLRWERLDVQQKSMQPPAAFWAVSTPVWLSECELSGLLWSETFWFWRKSYCSGGSHYKEAFFGLIACLTVKQMRSRWHQT